MYWIVCTVALLGQVEAPKTPVPANPRLTYVQSRLERPLISTAVGWRCVRKELELTDDQASRISHAYQIASRELDWGERQRKELNEDKTLTAAEKLDYCKGMLEKCQARQGEIICETLLPHQIDRAKQCFCWLLLNRQPFEVLQHIGGPDPIAEEKMREIYSEYEERASQIIKSKRLELEKIAEAEFSPAVLKKLEEIASVRLFTDEDDNRWYYQGIWPKMKVLFEEPRAELQEQLDELYATTLKKMLAELPETKQKEWREQAGEFVQFPAPTFQLVGKLGRFKYARVISF